MHCCFKTTTKNVSFKKYLMSILNSREQRVTWEIQRWGRLILVKGSRQRDSLFYKVLCYHKSGKGRIWKIVYTLELRFERWDFYYSIYSIYYFIVRDYDNSRVRRLQTLGLLLVNLKYRSEKQEPNRANPHVRGSDEWLAAHIKMLTPGLRKFVLNLRCL